MRRRILLVVAAIAGLTLAACQKEKTVEIGGVMALTGPLSSYGESMLKGAQLALDTVQERGDLGMKLEFEVLDSESDPATAARLAGDLYDKGCVAVIAGVSSAEAVAMVPVADDHERLLLAPAASTPQLTGISTNFFRLHPSDHAEGTRMSTLAVQKLNISKVGIVVSDSTYGRGVEEVFRDDFERLGGEVVAEVEFPPNSEDLSTPVDEVLASHPEAVFISGHDMEIVGVLKVLRERKFAGQILTTSALATQTAIDAAGDLIDGVLFSQTVFDVSSDLEPIKGFVTAYKARYGAKPDFYAAHGYDSMLVLAEALTKWDGIPVDLWRAFAGISSFPGVTGSIQFNEQGDVQKYPRVFRFQNGVPIDFEKYLESRQEAIRERMRALAEKRRSVSD